MQFSRKSGSNKFAQATEFAIIGIIYVVMMVAMVMVMVIVMVM